MIKASHIATLTVSLFMAACGATASQAEDIQRPRPWVNLGGDDRVAVGTCPDVDGGSGDTCFIVRCDADLGPIFVMQQPDIVKNGIRKLKIKIGRYRQTLTLHDHTANERILSLRDNPELLTALKSISPWASAASVASSVNYSTQFSLNDAKPRIDGVIGACKS